MYSETFIGREVFAAVWGIGVLAAVAAADTVRLPFDPQLREFISKHRKAFADTWTAVRDAVPLSEAVAQLAEDDAPWSGAPNKYPDLDSVKSHIVLADPNPQRYVGTSELERMTLNVECLRGAVRHLLASLVGGLLSGYWTLRVAAAKGMAEAPEQVWNRMLAVFHPMAHLLVDTRLIAEESRSLLSAAWIEWMEVSGNAVITDPNTDADFRDWLTMQMEWMARR